MLAITEAAANNRHLLRNEFAEAVVLLRGDVALIQQHVQAGNLAQVTETARMEVSLEELKSDVQELRRGQEKIEPRVRTLEAGAVAAREVSSLKRWVVGATMVPSVGFIVTLGLYFAQQH